MKRLRRNLSIIFFLSATLIVGVTLVAALMLSERQYSTTIAQQYQNTVNSVAAKLQRETAISTRWLAEIEMENNVILHIEDNGRPFFFQGVVKTVSDRDRLLEKAKVYSEAEPEPLTAFPDIMQAQFMVAGDSGESYRTSVLTIPNDNGEYIAIIMRDETPYQTEITGQRRIFILLGAAAIFAFFMISRMLAKKAVEPTVHSIRQQTDFVAAASHELRSPLAVIRAGLQTSDGAVEEQTMEIVRRETERLGRLTDDLLFLATSDSDSWSIHKQEFSPDTLCLNLYEAFRPVAGQRAHDILLELPEDILPDIFGDEGRIEQVLIILLNNAISHTPAGTIIRLSARKHGKAVVFSVTDNGSGIQPEDLQRIFDRFYKADKSRSDKQRLGLGLSIAKEIIRKHGGRIWAENIPGGGASFQVSIPVHGAKQ